MEPVFNNSLQAGIVDDVLAVAPVITLGSVDAKIAQVQRALATITAESYYAKDTYFWRSYANKTRGFTAVGHCKEAFKTIDDTLLDDRSTLYKDVVEVLGRSDLATRLQTLQGCEVKALTCQQTVTLLAGMKESRYQILYPIMREQVAALDALVASQDDIKTKVDRLAEILAECTKATEEYLVRDVAIELYKLVGVAANKLKEQLDNTVIMEDRKIEVVDSIDGQLRTVDSSLSAVRAEVKTIFYKKLWVPLDTSDAAKEALNRLKTYVGDLYFWKNAPTGTWAGYKLGYYPQTGAHGVLMEEEIGQRIAGLSQRLQKKLLQICRAEVPPEKQEKLNGKLDECLHYYNRLAEDIESHFEILFTLPHDGLHETVRNYAFGLRAALSEVAHTLALVKDLSCQYSKTVFKAQRIVKAFLVPQVIASNVDVASFTDACLLFDVGMSIREVKEAEAQKVPRFVHEAAGYVTRTSNLVQQVFAKHAPVCLALSDEEKAVWEIILKRESLDTLYYKTENRQLLPKRLQTVVIKLATRALFLSKDGEVNSRLELLLSLIKRDDKYLATCQSVAQFRTIIDEYDSWHAPWRRDQLLQQADEVLSAIFKAESEQADVLVYSKIVQRCIEFARRRVSPDEGNAVPNVQKRRDSLAKLLFERLDALAQRRAYVRFYDKFLAKQLDYWVTELDDGYTVLTEIDVHARDIKNRFPGEIEQDCKKRLLESFVLRVLVACLHEENDAERAEAQEHVNNILELEGYAEYRNGFSDYIKQILFENTVNKILGGKLLVGPNELKAFIEGPVQEFLGYTRVAFSSNKLQHALYVLILKEQGLTNDRQVLTNMFKEAKDEQAFDKWFSDYRVFLVSSSANNVFIEAMQKGAEVLKNHVGANEACKLQQIAEQVRLYSGALAK